MSDKNYFLYEFIKLLLIKVGLQDTESLEKTFFHSKLRSLTHSSQDIFSFKKAREGKVFCADYIVEKMDYHRLAY